MTKKQGKGSSSKTAGSLGGLLGGLGDLVERLAELAEKGEELSKIGGINLKHTGTGKDLKGVYGVSFKVGIGGQGVKVEPFGNVRKDHTTGESVVQEIHEPIVDLFDEEDHVLVIAEMPGIDAEDVEVAIKDDILTLSARTEDRQYFKEVLLPGDFREENVTVSSRNGIVKIRCAR